MQVLEIVSKLWKAGIEIYRDESDGRLALKGANETHKEILQQAQEHFNEIEQWFTSWEKETAINKTMLKIFALFCGWQRNDLINKWLSSDLESLDKVDRWIKAMERNGYKNIYEDFRPYANDESNKLAKELFDSAVAYVEKTKGAKGNA